MKINMNKRRAKKLSTYLKNKKDYYIYMFPYDFYSFIRCGRKYSLMSFDMYSFFPLVVLVPYSNKLMVIEKSIPWHEYLINDK